MHQASLGEDPHRGNLYLCIAYLFISTLHSKKRPKIINMTKRPKNIYSTLHMCCKNVQFILVEMMNSCSILYFIYA
jgi:hypothetical protein